MKKFTYLLVALIFMIACGPSAEEKATQQVAQQKAHDDSLKTVAEETMKKKMEEKASLEQSILELKAEKEGVENRLMVLRANLETAEDQMRRIKEFQLMRTPSERDAQIRNQSIVISTIEKDIQDTQERHQKVLSRLQNAKNQLALIKHELNEPYNNDEDDSEKLAASKAMQDSIAAAEEAMRANQ